VLILGQKVLYAFLKRYPKAKASINAWKLLMAANNFKIPGDLRKTVKSVSFVDNLAVFNISKNDYRLISTITYPILVRTLQILTHKEYDKGNWKK